MAKREDLIIMRAARKGDTGAQIALGKRYLLGGNGLPQHLPTALNWLSQAAQQGALEACILIGRHIPAEVASNANVSVYTWYERAMEAGIDTATLVLAELFLLPKTKYTFRQTTQKPSVMTGAQKNKLLQALQTSAHKGSAEAQWLLAQYAEQLQKTRAQNAPQTNDVMHSDLLTFGKTCNETAEKIMWATHAAEAGMTQAHQYLAEIAWKKGNAGLFLKHGRLLTHRLLAEYGHDLPHDLPCAELAYQLSTEKRQLLRRVARVLAQMSHLCKNDQTHIQKCLTLAAMANDRSAQMALGLWYARMDGSGQRITKIKGSANYKKAIHWLILAGNQGLANAWYILSRIYTKIEFSQRNSIDTICYLKRAAKLGHVQAQIEYGIKIWKHRHHDDDKAVEAVYWLNEAMLAGSETAKSLLSKIASMPMPAPWAIAAQQKITSEITKKHPLLMARIELAAVFGLHRHESLLVDIHQADKRHCLTIDISAHHARCKRRFILIQTAKTRQCLDHVSRVFEGIDCSASGPEGNYRQRLYLFKSLFPSLNHRMEKEAMEVPLMRA